MASAAAAMNSTPSYIKYLVTDPNRFESELKSARGFCNVIEKVKGYALPEKPSCIDYIKHIAYRIWNAFKAIFCMSDWQQARRITINLRVEEGFTRQEAEKDVDTILSDLLKNNPQKTHQDLKVTITFSDIVIRASQAKDKTALEAVGHDPSVLSFLRGKAFNDFVAKTNECRSLSTSLFGNSETIKLWHKAFLLSQVPTGFPKLS